MSNNVVDYYYYLTYAVLTTNLQERKEMQQSTYQLTATKASKTVIEAVQGMRLAKLWQEAYKRNGYVIQEFKAVR